MIIGNYVEATNSLKDVLEMYSLNIEKLGNKSIEVTKFNENYFTNGKNLIMFTSQLFEDYKQHCLSNNKIVGIIEFLEDSVENNHYLSDYLEKCKFDVIENRVIIKESKNLSNNNSYEILGEFYFDNYGFTLTYGGYFFIENLSDKNEQYFYYGD
ncbi:MAG: hypothetical protein PHD79_07930 [Aliarcobacter sp.]|nr:hypothetical protein [Aliarcobacter sp.]